MYCTYTLFSLNLNLSQYSSFYLCQYVSSWLLRTLLCVTVKLSIFFSTAGIRLVVIAVNKFWNCKKKNYISVGCGIQYQSSTTLHSIGARHPIRLPVSTQFIGGVNSYDLIGAKPSNFSSKCQLASKCNIAWERVVTINVLYGFLKGYVR